MHVRKLLNQCVSWTGYELGKVPDHPGRDYLADIRQLVGVPTVLLDVGANEGQSVVEFRRAFPQVQIHCFEPFPAAFERLKATASLYPGVQVNHTAVGAKRGEASLFVNVHSVTNSLLPATGQAREFSDQPEATQNQGHVTVPVTTLDDYCTGLGIAQIDLLKIDTQGFELPVLTGGRGLLAAKQVRAVLLELNLAPMYEGQSRPGQVVDFLSDHGYRLVGIYNTHYHNNRSVKWCDGLFVTE
jgi:FkbM family methyltransferase